MAAHLKISMQFGKIKAEQSLCNTRFYCAAQKTSEPRNSFETGGVFIKTDVLTKGLAGRSQTRDTVSLTLLCVALRTGVHPLPEMIQARRMTSSSDTPDTALDKKKLEADLVRLRVEHGDLNDAINALELVGGADQLQIQRLKRRKLLLKDQISKLEDQITPDIIA